MQRMNLITLVYIFNLVFLKVYVCLYYLRYCASCNLSKKQWTIVGLDSAALYTASPYEILGNRMVLDK